MAVDALIRDGTGSKRAATVTENHALCTQEIPGPPFGLAPHMRIFRQYLTADGTSAGSNDMLVDGSSTNVDFWVPPHAVNDRYIVSLSFLIADAGASLSEWGNTNAALANGFRLFYSDNTGEVDIASALQTNFDFVRLCSGRPSFGDAGTAFQAPNVVSTSDAYLPVLDIRSTFGMPWGVELRAGSSQRLTLRVRDNATGPDQFDVIAYGFERVPD